MFSTTSSKNRPRRVMHFLESGGLYGAESVVLNLSREMLKACDYFPVIACIVQNSVEQVALYEKAVSFGIESHKIIINNKKFPFDILLFLFKLKKLRIDLIHSHGYKSSIIAFISMLFLRIPVLPTCHLWFWSKAAPLKFRVMTAMEIFLYRFLKVITVVSQPIKQTLVQRGIHPEKIQIIRNGVNLDDFIPLTESEQLQLGEELGLEVGVPVIINLGRLTEQKAHINIIRAAQILKNHGQKFIILIIGDGSLREELEHQIQERGVEAEVRILGFREDAKKLLQLADVFLLPSLDEGMPMALLEAMASRVPVIATGVGDVPEIIEAGKCGVEIIINDVGAIVEGIERLIKKGSDKLIMINNGYAKVVTHYSSGKMLSQYCKIYKEVEVG